MYQLNTGPLATMAQSRGMASPYNTSGRDVLEYYKTKFDKLLYLERYGLPHDDNPTWFELEEGPSPRILVGQQWRGTSLWKTSL